MALVGAGLRLGVDDLSEYDRRAWLALLAAKERVAAKQRRAAEAARQRGR
jgi:hypothetical protein